MCKTSLYVLQVESCGFNRLHLLSDIYHIFGVFYAHRTQALTLILLPCLVIMSNERRRFRRSYRLHYGTQIYQDKNKTKGSVNLLELINLGDEIREEICDIYMEGQYHGFCKYLLECMEDVD